MLAWTLILFFVSVNSDCKNIFFLIILPLISVISTFSRGPRPLPYFDLSRNTESKQQEVDKASAGVWMEEGQGQREDVPQHRLLSFSDAVGWRRGRGWCLPADDSARFFSLPPVSVERAEVPLQVFRLVVVGVEVVLVDVVLIVVLVPLGDVLLVVLLVLILCFLTPPLATVVVVVSISRFWDSARLWSEDKVMKRKRQLKCSSID